MAAWLMLMPSLISRDSKYDSEKWLLASSQSELSVRARMVESLISSKQLIGITRDGVGKKLGETSASKNYPSSDIRYSLGGCGLPFNDKHHYLVIKLEDDIVRFLAFVCE